MKTFIDTSAFVALLVEKEGFHEKVAKKYLDYSAPYYLPLIIS